MKKNPFYRRRTGCKNDGFKDEEIWLDVIGYEGIYQVSSHGRVKSLNHMTNGTNGCLRLIRGRILKLKLDKAGYHRVNIYKNQKQKNASVHRLVASAFIPNQLDFVDHIDGVRSNNHISNLRWVTPRINAYNQHVSNSKTGVTGIQYRNDRIKNPWLAHIKCDGKCLHLGGFPTKDEAVAARNLKISQIFEEAILNEEISFLS